METLGKLFGSLLLFFYRCFDRLVMHGYLRGLSRPGNVVFYFRDVLGLSPITPEVLARPTRQYQAWVEAYARQHRLPFQWAPKGVRKEDFVRPWRLPVGFTHGKRRPWMFDPYGVEYLLAPCS